MTHRTETIERDDWLGHAAALRRLAASLLADEHEADDLVQESWLRARRSGDAVGAPWYRTVIRNLARDRLRERGRRSASERGAAKPERLPSEEEVAARLEVARRVAVEVAQLAEPYRTAVHLRYFEDLSPAEIARIAGVPVETVRTRLRRGLETLRERMDRAHGGQRDAWALALAPLAARAVPSAGGVLAATGAIMGTKLAIAGAAAVVAAGFFFLWPRLRSAEPHPPATVGSRSDGGLDANKEIRARIAGALAPTRESVPSPSPAPARAAEAGLVEVRGTAVVEDEQGAEHAHESGTLTIAHFLTESDAKIVEVPVQDGAWQTSIPDGRSIVVGKLVAGGREVLLPQPRPLLPGPDPIAVRGKWLSRGWLRVVDARTKQELSGIDVRGGIVWRAGPQWIHPGDDARMKTFASGAPSPVELPEATGLGRYWVHAPGHAWERVEFDHRVGGQRTIELSPEPSSLTVSIVGGAIPEKAFVRLYSRAGTFEESGLTFRMPERPPHYLAAVSVGAPAEGSVRIDDLRGGEYTAAVEIGEYQETMRIGEAPVDLPSGGTASVSVPIDPSILDVPRTHLSGVIEVPEGMDVASCRLRLQRIGGGEHEFHQGLPEMSFARGDERRRRFDAGLVRTGDYDATIQGVQYRLEIHAPGPGETQVTIRIPPLTSVSFDVVDALSGARLEPERVQWAAPDLQGMIGFELSPLHRDPRTGLFQFVAARGEIEVLSHLAGYENVRKPLTLDGPELRFTVSMTPSSGLAILFREDGAALPVGFDFVSGIRIVREDGATGLDSHSESTDSTLTVNLRAPGRYRIEFPELAGFEPIAARVVDVGPGKVAELTIEPKRKR